PRIEQVQQPGVAVWPDLDDVALEELGGEPEEAEGARDRVAEGVHLAAVLEVVPDLVVVDAEAALREEALVALSRRTGVGSRPERGRRAGRGGRRDGGRQTLDREPRADHVAGMRLVGPG